MSKRLVTYELTDDGELMPLDAEPVSSVVEIPEKPKNELYEKPKNSVDMVGFYQTAANTFNKSYGAAAWLVAFVALAWSLQFIPGAAISAATAVDNFFNPMPQVCTQRGLDRSTCTNYIKENPQPDIAVCPLDGTALSCALAKVGDTLNPLISTLAFVTSTGLTASLMRLILTRVRESF